MYFLYSAALFTAIIAAAPYFLYKALKHGKYLGSLRRRLWLDSRQSIDYSGPRLLVHCVSVGEFLAAEPLLESLRKKLPTHRIVVTTTTETGQTLARDRASSFADVRCFPLDFAFAVRRMLDEIKPSAVVVLETELWPNFLLEVSKRRIPIILANGRISDRSFPRYRFFSPLFKGALNRVSSFMMQSERDAERMRNIGAPADRVWVCGNIKYDSGSAEQAARLDGAAAALEKRLDLNRSAPLFVAGSTVAGEEAMIISAYKSMLSDPQLSDARLLLAPRRPERFDQVAEMLSAAGLSFVRRSKLESDNAGSNGSAPIAEAKAILLDSIGELAAVYRYADLVFVGGSLARHGGHNILEPASYGKAIVTGPHTSNFQKIMEDFASAGAVVQLPEECGERRLTEELIRLMKDERLRSDLGKRAKGVMEANRGALERQAAKIAEMVENINHEEH